MKPLKLVRFCSWVNSKWFGVDGRFLGCYESVTLKPGPQVTIHVVWDTGLYFRGLKIREIYGSKVFDSDFNIFELYRIFHFILEGIFRKGECLSCYLFLVGVDLLALPNKTLPQWLRYLIDSGTKDSRTSKVENFDRGKKNRTF